MCALCGSGTCGVCRACCLEPAYRSGCCMSPIGVCGRRGNRASGGSDDAGGPHGDVSVWCSFFGVDGEGWEFIIRCEVGARNGNETLVLESSDGIAQPRGLIARNGGDELVIEMNLDGAAEEAPAVSQAYE